MEDIKRLLIITYYWPPTGGSGVQRWAKFSKYLPEYGWQPVIYTPENPERLAYDDSLLRDIRRKRKSSVGTSPNRTTSTASFSEKANSRSIL